MSSVEMKESAEILKSWLDIRSRAELSGAIRDSRVDFDLPQARRLTSRLRQLEQSSDALRIGVVHTYTSNLLDIWFSFESALQGLGCEIYHAPYGLVLQEAHSNSGLVRHRPDVTVLMLQRGDLQPALGRPLAGLTAEQRRELREATVESLCGVVRPFRDRIGGLILLTILPELHRPGLGLFDSHSERSEAAWWAAVKAGVTQRLRDTAAGVLFLDLDDTLAQIGRERFCDPRFWYTARFPFSPPAAREFARRIVALGAVSKQPRAKVIVLDADNTLWGGIIGEDGPNGIALGPDYPGNAYMAFQRRLLDYQSRGFILAMCSKNNPADVDEVLAKHPHQLLRSEHFAARRVNWDPKPGNLVLLAQDLNVGLSSFIFVDDSVHECAAVHHELPQVEVVRTPSNPVRVPTCLDRVARLEIISLTDEDLAKTELYARERQRRELREDVAAGGGNLMEYLRSLEMRMWIGYDDRAQLARLTQLTQKTNQFNLTTRRYDEQRVKEFIDSPEWLVAHFSLADAFGDNGVVGLALLHRVSADRVELDTFLMSCRVIGREAEGAFLEAVLRRLQEEEVVTVVADYLPTAKNQLAADFLSGRRFGRGEDGRYYRSLVEAPAASAADFPVAVDTAPRR